MKTKTEEKKYERKNRFNGESVMLTAEEATKHDAIFYHEYAATLEDQKLGTGASEHWKKCESCLTGSGSTTPALTWCYLISPGAGPARALNQTLEPELKPTSQLTSSQAYSIRFYRRKKHENN